MISKKQEALFAALPEQGTLIFAAGPRGISANIVGQFSVQRRDSEDLLCMGDGTHHVHIDWSRIQEVQIGDFHGEGVLTFFDGEETLFRLYRPQGSFTEALTRATGSLLD